jgi:NitT/TauT family transport system ATP-binding protein
MVGLSGFGDAWPHQLSGGMRSRVALARSLVIEPDVLLMDEPFSKLDPQTRTQMHEEVLRIQAMKNMTILFVTHDVEEAVILADRIVLMAPRPGRIREIDAVSLPRPRTPTDRDVAEQTRQLRMKVQE